jgi:hypothetical protein
MWASISCKRLSKYYGLALPGHQHTAAHASLLAPSPWHGTAVPWRHRHKPWLHIIASASHTVGDHASGCRCSNPTWSSRVVDTLAHLQQAHAACRHTQRSMPCRSSTTPQHADRHTAHMRAASATSEEASVLVLVQGGAARTSLYFPSQKLGPGRWSHRLHSIGRGQGSHRRGPPAVSQANTDTGKQCLDVKYTAAVSGHCASCRLEWHTVMHRHAAACAGSASVAAHQPAIHATGHAGMSCGMGSMREARTALAPRPDVGQAQYSYSTSQRVV